MYLYKTPNKHICSVLLERSGGGGGKEICKVIFLNYTLTADQSSHLEPLIQSLEH